MPSRPANPEGFLQPRRVDGRDKPGHDGDGDFRTTIAMRIAAAQWFNSPYKSRQSGLTSRIRRTFQARGQCFMLRSRWIASRMLS